MGTLVNYVTPLHKATQRLYIDRMVDDKVKCMIKAKEYEFDYWDGVRRFGYGGYKYMLNRWKPVAEELISNYRLSLVILIQSYPKKMTLLVRVPFYSPFNKFLKFLMPYFSGVSQDRHQINAYSLASRGWKNLFL